MGGYRDGGKRLQRGAGAPSSRFAEGDAGGGGLSEATGGACQSDRIVRGLRHSWRRGGPEW